MKTQNNLVIDPEFAGLIPKPRPDEVAGLEESLRTEGCRDALVVWAHNGKHILLDGHTRFPICERLDIPFTTTALEFATRDEARLWILRNQANRRNLSDDQRAIVLDEIIEQQSIVVRARQLAQARAAKAAKVKGGGVASVLEDVAKTEKVPINTRAELSAQYKLSQHKAKNAKLLRTDPRARQEVKDGKLALADAAKLIGRTPEFRSRAIAMIESGTAKSVVDAARLIKREDAKDAPPLPAGKYRVLYADPPWPYGNVNLSQYGHASYHYLTEKSIRELCEMEIADRAADNAVLFLWVTAPMLENGFRVISAWDFVYKENIVWSKLKHVFGHYVSVRHEHLLIATRGSCLPDSPKLIESVQVIERLKHSEKPEQFRDIIDQMYVPPQKGRNDRLELFARETSSKPRHWDYWGNEAEVN